MIDRPVDSYSGGQRRRLEIARALVSEPQVLFLDEPTVGLDPRFRFELLDLIAGLRARSGMTILLTTHYLDEAEQLCDRVAIVHQGRIVALDSPAALLARMGRELVELRVDGDVATAVTSLRAAASPATTPSPSAPPSTCRCTTDRRARRPRPSPTWAYRSPRSPAVPRPSTTSTSSSPASRSPPEPVWRRRGGPDARRTPIRHPLTSTKETP